MAMNHLSYTPANWDEHLGGILPGKVFCGDLFCWCHGDERKLAFIGNVAGNKLIEEANVSAIIDGIVPVSPELLMVEALPTGFIEPEEKEEQA